MTSPTRTRSDDDADDDDENCSERDDWPLDVPVHVLQPSVGAISFADFETMSEGILADDSPVEINDGSLTFTCASVIFKPLANWERSEEARYFCR